LQQLTHVPWTSSENGQQEGVLSSDVMSTGASTSAPTSSAVANHEGFPSSSDPSTYSSLSMPNIADLPSQFTAAAANMNLTLPADKDVRGINLLANSKNSEGLTVVTLGHLQPKNMAPPYTTPNDSTSSGQACTSSTATGPSSDNTMRVHRKTYIPGWSVPPRVLLVDDDSVCRNLSSKLLQVFGCTFDVATDGVEALKKLGLERYDLVLMVVYLFLLSNM
jgi:osomolarity two-component system response regulator SKN7